MAEISKSDSLSASDSFMSQRWVMTSVMLGTGTVSINNSSFNPAIPQMMQDFRIAEAAVSWVIVIFLLTMSLSLLVTGFLSQRFGKRHVYLSALIIFMLSSIGGAFASSFETVLVIRALQGFSSGLMIPLSLGIIFSVTPQEQRGTATGLWGAMIMLTLACGPMLGALILVWFNWHALFLLNVPLVLFALTVGWLYLPKQSGSKNLKFDWLGFGLLAISIVSLLVALSTIKQLEDLQHVSFYALFTLSCFTALCFFTLSRKKVNSIIAWQLFQSRAFNYSLIISVVHTVSLFISLLLIPLLIQNTLQLSPIWTGLLLMSSALSTSLCSKRAGKYLDQHGAKQLISFGMVLTVIAFVGLGLVANISVILLIVCMLIHGLGFGLSYMPATTAGLNHLHDSEVTQGAAVNNLFRRLCAAVAVVMAALYLQIRTQYFLSSYELPIAQLYAIRELFFFCAGMTLLALPYAWKFPKQKHQKLHV
ncbi:DHA2 family efflux MFS transporter permease subunit [Acinetobacter sp. TTH0-4]|uniref:DHA2 family efflux MFS transporter permease subunit n=1 Tax=Acinetobacter sp. TTH0-4 TaxID=1646498 RepID=UPI00189E7F00|nr:DHA2 family efflux MFS transporter permease subunit [Acinetobacter sp. TTH0-4]QPF39065.1 DHA2 family efflux MFS transporter permease subunit [Acinetobacter sp. TTH0-4]